MIDAHVNLFHTPGLLNFNLMSNCKKLFIQTLSAVLVVIMFRLLVVLAIISCVASFAHHHAMSRRSEMRMSFDTIQSKFGKAVSIASMGFLLAGPVIPTEIVHADGAVSASTVYRARIGYGNKIKDLAPAAEKGDFAAFAEKKVLNAFDLFISSSNALKNPATKAKKVAEKAIEAQIYSAVKAKDAAALKSAYNEFIKVADLSSEYKPNELGQTDSSGYSPTYGTKNEYIYQR